MTATLFGTLNGTSIEPYVHKSGKQLYRAITGSREAAIAKMASEHHLVTWLLRGGGFLMMWVGLGLLLGPVNAVLDFVPLFGGLSRALIGLATFVIALCLSITIIVVSMIAHNPVLLIGAVIVVLAAIWGVGRLRSGQKTRAPRPKVSDNAADVREEFDAAESGEEEEAMQIATRGSGPAPAKIRFECDECGKRYSVNSSLAGKKARCKRCGNRVVIPATSAE
jgi:predicted Zn finger-like uncharacterized protein